MTSLVWSLLGIGPAGLHSVVVVVAVDRPADGSQRGAVAGPVFHGRWLRRETVQSVGRRLS